MLRTSTGVIMPTQKSEVLQGTLDMLVLKTLQTIGPMHGWGIAKRIQQLSDRTLQLTQGTIYPALLRLEQKGLIKAEWGTSDSNRKARFYKLTKAGIKQLRKETENWEQMMTIINRILEST
jgi:PadR family transcriptional regulator, regulatory protein PadR